MSRRDLKNSFSPEKKERSVRFQNATRPARAARGVACGVRIAMDALAGATLVADPEPYVGRLAAASPCADTANDAASTSGGSRGVPLFASARVPPSNDAATTIEVVEDLAVFAGGACGAGCPARAGAETTRHVAVERAREGRRRAPWAPSARARARARAGDGARG